MTDLPPIRSMTPTRGILARIVVAAACAAGVVAMGAAGCSHDGSDGEGGAGEGTVGEAKQAIVSATACVSVNRGGPYGAVTDAQINNKQPPSTYGTSATTYTGVLSGTE